MKSISLFILLIVIFLLSSNFVFARNYKVAIADVPVKDIYINLIKAMDEETDDTFEIQIAPFSRCVYYVEINAVDFSIPQTEVPNPKKQSELKYEFSTTFTYKVNYVLYYNRNKVININDIKTGNLKYNIETELSQLPLFDFPIKGSTSIEASLKRIENGMIDGFIFPAAPTEAALKKLDLKNLSKVLYQQYNSKFIIPKGGKNTEVDNMLTDLINRLKTNGKFQKIMESILKSNSIF